MKEDSSSVNGMVNSGMMVLKGAFCGCCSSSMFPVVVVGVAAAATTAVAVSVVPLSQVVGVAWLPLVRQPLAVSRLDSSGADKVCESQQKVLTKMLSP